MRGVSCEVLGQKCLPEVNYHWFSCDSWRPKRARHVWTRSVKRVYCWRFLLSSHPLPLLLIFRSCSQYKFRFLRLLLETSGYAGCVISTTTIRSAQDFAKRYVKEGFHGSARVCIVYLFSHRPSFSLFMYQTQASYPLLHANSGKMTNR